MKLLIISFFSLTFLCAQTKQSQHTEAEAKEIIDSLYIKAVNGADFAKLADKYSEDPGTAGKGGKYANVARGVFVEEFENVIFNLKLNEISKPFKTGYGYRIAKLIGREGETCSVRHILIRFQ